MTTPSFPTIWYWVVGDTNPTTQVWEGSSGAMVANTAANYQSWVANGGSGGLGGAAQINVTGAANNGAGLIRLTIDTSAPMVTNGRWVVQNVGGTVEANNTWPITIIDTTHVDLQGSTFVHAFTSNGVIDRGSSIDTIADLYVYINAYNLQVYNAAGPSALLTSSLVDYTLTNPMPSYLGINFLASGKKLILPAAQLFGSPPIGVQFIVDNYNSALGFGIYDTLNNHIIDMPAAFVRIQLVCTDGTGKGGGWKASYIGNQVNAFSIAIGGTGQSSLTANAVLLGEGVGPVGFAAIGTAGRLLIDQGAAADPAFEAMSGDATITNAGALTIAKIAGDTVVATTTWVPSDQSGAGLTITNNGANSNSYYKIGKLVIFTLDINYPATASGLSAIIGGLPATIYASGTNSQSGLLNLNTGAGGADRLQLLNGSTTMNFVAGIAASPSTNANLTGARLRGSGMYFTA